jgi:predicted nucleic acid-binding protein
LTGSYAQAGVFVVDSSVAVKWFVQEAGSAEALALVAPGRVLLAPDLLIAEVSSILTQKIRSGEFPADGLGDALEELTATVSLVSSVDLAVDGQRLALGYGTSLYDCLFLALAIREEAILATADRRIVNGMGAAFAQRMRLVEGGEV